MAHTPEITIAVAATERQVRLRWLLNALEDQTLARERFEVVVAHHGDCATSRLLREHPLAADSLRGVVASPDGTAPGALHNLAWREAQAALVAFTTDACRPHPQWLERLLEAAASHPGAVVQGRTVPDPEEPMLMQAPRRRAQRVEPPAELAEPCNVLYPRELLERLGGFDAALLAGQGADLVLRAKSAGATLEAAPEALSWHGVLSVGLPEVLRTALRERGWAAVLARHPELRESLPWFVFVSRPHALLAPALAVGLVTRRRVLTVVAALPYLRHALRVDPYAPRPFWQRLLGLPGRVAEDAVGIGALAYSSFTRRTLLL